MSSICCKSHTRIGYYSDTNEKYSIIIGKIGTFCCKCNKLCYTKTDGKYYNYDGKILDIKVIRKMKLDKLI